jgi:hypothetical protein
LQVAQTIAHEAASEEAARWAPELLERGRAEFGRLLTLDQACRNEQRVIGSRTDLTSFVSLRESLQNAGAFRTPLREPPMAEQVYGRDKAYRRATKIEVTADLWKVFENEPRLIRHLFEYRDVFESLIFGRSLLESIGPDGRIHSGFFSDPSRSDPVRLKLLVPWRPYIKAAERFLTIRLLEPSWMLLCWLSEDSGLRHALSDGADPLIYSLASRISGLHGLFRALGANVCQ